MPMPMFGYSSLSRRLIANPEATTTAVVATTITPAAFRTEGGSCMKRVSRRSIRFQRPMSRGHRKPGARDVPAPRAAKRLARLGLESPLDTRAHGGVSVVRRLDRHVREQPVEPARDVPRPFAQERE